MTPDRLMHARDNNRALPAAVFLLAAGGCLGLTAIFAKMAFHRGLDGSVFLFASVGVAAALLWLESIRRRHRPMFGPEHVRYYLGSAIFSIVAPNLILFSVIPEVGSGYASLSLALPPMLTYAAAVGLRMEKASLARLAGVALALVGSLWLAAQKLTGSTDPQLEPLLLLALVPVLLATGNIYRAKFWPRAALPDQLAPGMLIAAVFLLAPAAALFASSRPQVISMPAALLIGLQGAILALQYLMFFELQRRGGPVVLSLIGSVAAVVAVPISVAALGEPWPRGLAIGAALIALGIGFVIWPRHHRP